MTNENAPRLNPAQAAFFCLAVLQATQAARKGGSPLAIVPLMIGNPGVGKTAIARQIAQKLKYDGLIVITPTLHNTLDLRGLPYVREGETHFASSTILPRSGKWLLLIDELADCPPHEQSGFYQLLLERRLGEYVLPEDCDVIGATNDETMGAAANPLSSAIKTRVAPVYVVSEVEQTLKYALINGWNHKVVGYIKQNPQVLDAFNASDYAGGATSRGLEQLSMVENGGMNLPQVQGDDDVVQALCSAMLGIDHGMRYAVYRKLNCPDPDSVWKNPKSAEIPADQGTRFAYSALLAAQCDTPAKFTALTAFAKRMGRVDAIGFITDAVRAHNKYRETASFAQFAAEYGDLIV